MTAAIAASTSVRYTGHLEQGARSVTVDMTVGRSEARGTVRFGAERVDLLRSVGILYLKAPRAVWQAQGVTDARALARVAGKWARLGEADAARFRVFTDLDYLVAGFGRPTYAVTGASAVNGVEGVELRDASDTVVVVGVAPPHPPLRITSPERGQLTFTHWNAPLTVIAPAGAVDLAG